MAPQRPFAQRTSRAQEKYRDGGSKKTPLNTKVRNSPKICYIMAKNVGGSVDTEQEEAAESLCQHVQVKQKQPEEATICRALRPCAG